ncbi:MAG: hypothetical protein POG74_09665 [Acidocella sp.]|nr:hypothetical protein [Acidocella sp.]
MEQLLPQISTVETPLVSLISAVSDELTELGQFAEQLQSTLSPSLLRLADDPLCHRNVQMLDLLSQRLSVLAVFFLSLGHAVPPGWLINSRAALSAVTLSELAWRLQGHHNPQEHHPAGELETF